MAEINLTQLEADVLLAMEKHRVTDDPATFPVGGQRITFALHSPDRREHFILDLTSGRIDLARVKLQNRARQVVVLARVDLGGRPHANPDGVLVPCPHLHIYREGYGDKWAVELPEDSFQDPADVWTTYTDFLRYCNISRPPRVERGLFT